MMTGSYQYLMNREAMHYMCLLSDMHRLIDRPLTGKKNDPQGLLEVIRFASHTLKLELHKRRRPLVVFLSKKRRK